MNKSVATGIAITCVIVLAVLGLSQADQAEGKHLLLRNIDDTVTVPAGKVWRIDGLEPWFTERGIGTADFYVKGQAFLGRDCAHTVSGDFEITINRVQQDPIWLLPDSRVTVGDSRGSVEIVELSESRACT
jgi:hypothetical protein